MLNRLAKTRIILTQYAYSSGLAVLQVYYEFNVKMYLDQMIK